MFGCTQKFIMTGSARGTLLVNGLKVHHIHVIYTAKKLN